MTASGDTQTVVEKSASLYDRVSALRNAASEKLASLRSQTSQAEPEAARTGDFTNAYRSAYPGSRYSATREDDSDIPGTNLGTATIELTYFTSFS